MTGTGTPALTLLRLRVSRQGESWNGVYTQCSDLQEVVYLQEQPANGYRISWRKEWWWICHGNDSAGVARQRDPGGPLTGAELSPWKVYDPHDAKFHSSDLPISVVAHPCNDPIASETRPGCSSIGNAAPCGLQLPGSRTPARRCADEIGAGDDSDWYVLEEHGMREPVEHMRPGEMVYCNVCLREGPAEGWVVRGRLEMDRHFGKQSSRAPRWSFVHPDGKRTFNNLKGEWSVESGGGLDAAGFKHVKSVQSRLRRELSSRRDELARAGRLIDEEFEAQWQEMLMKQCVGDGVHELCRDLRKRYLEIDQTPTIPEWRPPSWADASVKYAATLPTPSRKRCMGGEQVEGFFGDGVSHISCADAPDPGAAEGLATSGRRASHELQPHRRRDEFLSHVLRSLAPTGCRVTADIDGMADGGGTTADADVSGHKRPRRGLERDEPSETTEVEGIREAVGSGVGDQTGASEHATCSNDGSIRVATAAPVLETAPVAPRPVVQVASLVGDPAAAEAELTLHSNGPWEAVLRGDELECGELEHRRDLQRRFSESPGAVAVGWRYITAACALGRGGSQLPFAIIDLLAASQHATYGVNLARVLTVREAILAAQSRGTKDAALGNDVGSFMHTVLRHLVQNGLGPCEADATKTHGLYGLREFLARVKTDSEACAIQMAFRGHIGGDLGPLCAFHVLFFQGAGADNASLLAKMLVGSDAWAQWRRGLAALFGAVLSRNRVAFEAAWSTLDFALHMAVWPADAGEVARWELWLTMMLLATRLAVNVSHRHVAAPSFLRNVAQWATTAVGPAGEVRGALCTWRQFLEGASMLRDPNRFLPRVLCTPASLPTDSIVAAELLHRVQSRTATSGDHAGLTRLLDVWAREAEALLATGISAAKMEWGISEAEDAFVASTYPGRAVICAKAQQTWSWSWAGPSQQHQRWFISAAEAMASTVLLLLRGPRSWEAAEKIFCDHFARPPPTLSGKRLLWPEVPTESAVSGASFRGDEDDGGPSFHPNSALAHLSGQSFAQVFTSDGEARRPLVNWLLSAHLDQRKPGDSLAPAHVHAALQGCATCTTGDDGKPPATNPEVNRFARWVIEDVFDYRPPLLRLPKLHSGTMGKQADEELEHMALRARVTCHQFFAALIRRLPSTEPLPLWLRSNALVACLHASCVSLAAEGGYTAAACGGPKSQQLNEAVRELLCLLSSDIGGMPRIGSAGNSVLREVAALDEPTRAWAFGMLARDVYLLLLWVERLGSPACEPRVDALFCFAAACARCLGGRWPRPPTCPPPQTLPCATRLCFDPLKTAVPPGVVDGFALSAHILRRRPLAAVLAYVDAPNVAATLGSLNELEHAAGAGLQDASGKVRSLGGAWTCIPDLGAWAAALTGSDAEDFVRLRTWRSQTYSCLDQRGDFSTLRRLQCAVSSRCAAVHCAVELGRFCGSHSSPQKLDSAAGRRLFALAVALLRDLGDATCEATLMDHHAVGVELMSGASFSENGAASQACLEDTRSWSMRHLLYRYSALSKLFAGLGPNSWHVKGVGGGIALLPEAQKCLKYLHQWFLRAGLYDMPEERARLIARGFARATVELPWPEISTVEFPSVLAEEVAPPAASPDGCFDSAGGALQGLGGVWVAMVEAVQGSPLEGNPEL